MKYKIIIPKEEPKTAWVGVLHDKLNEYHPAEYDLKDIYQGEGCLPTFPNEELCQIWCDSRCIREPKQETIEEAAERLYPVNNTGSMFMANRDELNNSLKQEGFIEGAKWKQEKYDLLLIELNHTKTLLASCEKALEDSFKKEEEIEKLKIDTKEEEIKDLKSRLDVAKESSAKALKMIEVLEEQDKTKLNEEEVLDLLHCRNIELGIYESAEKMEKWFEQFKK